MAIMSLVTKQIRQDGPNLGPSFTMGLFLDPHTCHLLTNFHQKKKKKEKKKQTGMILASSIYLVFSFYLPENIYPHLK
jgi:hypothetical protein